MNPQTDLQFWLTVASEFNSKHPLTQPHFRCYLCNGSPTFREAWKDLESRATIQNLGEQFFTLAPPPEDENQTLSPRHHDSLFESPGFDSHRKIRIRFLLWNTQRLIHP